MNKEELAKKVTALVAMTYKHAYEKGQANPSEETIRKILRLIVDYEVLEIDTIERQVSYIHEHLNDE